MSSPSAKRSGNPATRAAAATGASSQPRSRSGANERSRAVLLRLSRLPTLAIPIVVLVLTLVGLGAPLPLAVPSLALVGIFVGWLSTLSWPVLGARGRFVRVLMLAVLVAAVVARVVGWL